jgi:kynurenine formamidase
MTDNAAFSTVPSWEELPTKDGLRCSWGVWGDEDVFGCLNLLTPERIAEAAKLVRQGKLFPLNWTLALPDPPLFARSRMVHKVVETPISADDHIDGFNTQSSSQWDGFLHIKHPALGRYNGERASGAHGIHHWASRGIAGRGVLVDVERWRSRQGRPLKQASPDPITVEDLEATLSDQGVSLRSGDILLIRTGWIAWYESLDPEARSDYANMAKFACPGLLPGEETARWLWDNHVAAVAADNPSLEIWPPGSTLSEDLKSKFWSDPSSIHKGFMHTMLLPLLGIPIGEMWYLEKLAADCAEDNRYEAFLVSAPLNIPGGVASPPNAVAIK